MLQQAAATGRKLFPAPVFSALRALGTLCGAPLRFSVTTGHASSALRGKAVDRNGDPIPWLTYPAIDLLSCKSLADRRVLEFGAGQSTLWFAKRAASVVSFESDPEWHSNLARALPSNAVVHLSAPSLDGIQRVLNASERFDIVLVDGLERVTAAKHALDRVTRDGVVIVDNSEGNWGPPPSYPIMDLFRAAGFMRVDFYGMAPGVIRAHCTSMFFRDGCFLFHGTENPHRLDDS